MLNYPGSFSLEIRLEINNFYELCQLCLPIIKEVELPSIKKWQIPLDNIPQSEGLEEKLIKLHTKITVEDENEDLYLSKFILEEDEKHARNNIVLRLCYYYNFEKHKNGHCELDFYIEKYHTVDDVQNFIDSTVNFTRRLLERTNVSYVNLNRSITDSLTPNMLVRDRRQMIFVTQKQIEERFDRPGVFWNAGWDIKEQYGDHFLLGRCLDMHKYFDDYSYLSEILLDQWNMVRASKPGWTKFYHAQPEESELFYSGEARLNLANYREESKTVEYSCDVKEDQYIQGWEIFKIWIMLNKGQMKDGKEVKSVRVVFVDKEKAEREKRPLLEAGGKVIYMNEKGEEVEIRE